MYTNIICILKYLEGRGFLQSTINILIPNVGGSGEEEANSVTGSGGSFVGNTAGSTGGAEGSVGGSAGNGSGSSNGVVGNSFGRSRFLGISLK